VEEEVEQCIVAVKIVRVQHQVQRGADLRSLLVSKNARLANRKCAKRYKTQGNSLVNKASCAPGS
jgi:hypothetical protein